MPLISRGQRARDCLTIALGTLLFAGLIRPFQNTPFLDDWVYAWSVENLLTHGRIEVLNYSDNVNVAQVAWGALACVPFGFSFTALRVSTWLLALAALCALYLLLLELDATRRDALLGTAVLAAYPTFAILSVTFMTDVPFLSMTMVASLAFIKGLRRRSLGWLCVASLAASTAIAIRAVGIVMPIGMALFIALHHTAPSKRKYAWSVLTLVPLVVFVMLYPFRAEIFHRGDEGWLPWTTPHRLALLRDFALPLLPQMLASVTALAIGVVGLALLPLTIASVRHSHGARTLAIAGVLALALAALYAIGVRYPLPLTAGAIWSFDELGASSVLVPDYGTFPAPAWLSWGALAVATLSIAAAIAAVWQTGMQSDSGRPFLLWSITGHLGLMSLMWLLYDRYALVLVPYALALFLSSRPRINHPLAVGTLALLAVVTGTALRDHLNYNAALWDAVALLRASGVADQDINGGYMVNGWLQYAHPEHARRNANGELDVPWVTSKSERPYKVANRVPPGWTALQQFPYERWLGSSGHIYALKSAAPPDPY